MSVKDVLEFLRQRQGLLQGVVLSGGEPTLYRQINHFATEIKKIGFQVKLDTNGTNPQKVKKLLQTVLLILLHLIIKHPNINLKR